MEERERKKFRMDWIFVRFFATFGAVIWTIGTGYFIFNIVFNFEYYERSIIFDFVIVITILVLLIGITLLYWFFLIFYIYLAYIEINKNGIVINTRKRTDFNWEEIEKVSLQYIGTNPYDIHILSIISNETLTNTNLHFSLKSQKEFQTFLIKYLELYDIPYSRDWIDVDP